MAMFSKDLKDPSPQDFWEVCYLCFIEEPKQNLEKLRDLLPYTGKKDNFNMNCMKVCESQSLVDRRCG